MKRQPANPEPPAPSEKAASGGVHGGSGAAAAQNVHSPGRPRAGTKTLVDIMLEKAMITHGQLEKALQVQQHGGGPLGRILIKMDVITEQELAHALALQWGVPFVSLTDVNIDRDAVKLIPMHLARRHKVLAVGKTTAGLRLAVADPVNVEAFDDVCLVTGLDVDPIVAMEEEIVAAIARYYGAGDMDDSIRQAADRAAESQTGNAVLDVADDRTEDASVEKLQLMVEDPPIVRVVNQITEQAILDGASDIHVEPQQRTLQVRYRIDGMLHDVMTLPKAVAPAIISRIKIIANVDIAERRLPQDGRSRMVIQEREYDLRISTLPTVFGESVVMRILDQARARVGLDKLGFVATMLQTWEELISKPYGMILVSGPTGSGKSTTLYATLNKLNTADKKVLTIEDPVEYQLPRVNQVQVNPKAGLTFATGLRAFLRQDPDIIMVGEIRDRETAEVAIQASLTGHLVLSTVHTNDAPSAISRLIQMGVEPFLATSSLIAVLAQRLARTICPHCKEAYKPPKEALRRLGLQPSDDEETVFYHGGSCNRCRGTGYKGRTGIFELMVVSDAIRELVLRGASVAEIRAQAVTEGMRPLREDGVLKALEGQTTADELFRVVFVEGGTPAPSPPTPRGDNDPQLLR